MHILGRSNFQITLLNKYLHLLQFLVSEINVHCLLKSNGDILIGQSHQITSNFLNRQFLLPLSLSVTQIWVHFSLTVFLKYDQLDLSKASDSITDCLTSIFPKNFWIFWIFLRGSHGLSAQRVRRTKSRCFLELIVSRFDARWNQMVTLKGFHWTAQRSSFFGRLEMRSLGFSFFLVFSPRWNRLLLGLPFSPASTHEQHF